MLFNMPSASASPGALDTSFGINGIVRTDIGGTYDWAYATAIQSDDSIIVAGVSNSHDTYDFALASYSPKGSLNWVTLTDFNHGSYDWAYSLALQQDGKIILGGVSDNRFALSRYNNNGLLDPSFGDSGKVTEKRHTLTSDIIHSVAIQPDGKIIAAGVTVDNAVTLNPQGDFMLARYHTDGSPDLTFGIGGIVTTDFDHGSYDEANTLVLQPDGKIVVGGYSNVRSRDALYGPDHLALARYEGSGVLDTSFGKGGTSIINGGTLKEAITSLLVTPDQTILMGGFINGEKRGDLLFARLNPDGSIKTLTISDLGTHSERITSLALRSDGKIVAGGQIAPSNHADFAIYQYDSNGLLEGVTAADFGGREDRVHAVVVQKDGKIVAVGQSETDFALARFNSN